MDSFMDLENPVLERMRAHSTVRRFEEDELPDSVVRVAVQSAQRAATSSHIQAYALLRVTDPADRARLAALAGGQEQVKSAGAFFVICADHRRHRLLAEATQRPREANLETFLLCVIDASLFAQNLVLAFESLGLGTCFVGGLRNRLRAVDELLHLPQDVLPLCGLCVGRTRASEAGGDAEQRPRLGVDAVYFQDRYPSDEAMLALIEDHDREMAGYYERRGTPGRDWTGGVTRLFSELRRTELLEFYRSKGAVFR